MAGRNLRKKLPTITLLHRQKRLPFLTNMRNITKTDEETIVWGKPNRKSTVQKRKIIRVWKDADSYDLKHCWDHYLGNEYDQPLSFWRELKIGAIRVVHLILERLEFNFKN